MLMFQLYYIIVLLLAASVSLSEKWCECSSTHQWNCHGACDNSDDRVGITNVLVNVTTDGSYGDEMMEAVGQLRMKSGIQYSEAIINPKYCNGRINSFNFTCFVFKDISTICENNSRSLPLRGAIWTNSYPIASKADSNRGNCSCNININAEEFQIEKFDYNLTNDQSLTLTFSNGSTYQDWESPFNFANVRNQSSVLRNVNISMTLEWANPDSEQELFFIGLEVTKGRVDVICEEGISLITSTLATETSTTSEKTSAIQTSQTSQPTSVTLTSPTREPTSAIKTSHTNESTSETLTSPTGESTPATHTTTKAPTTVSTDDISSTSKIVTSRSSSLTNSSFTKIPAVGKSQPPEEKNKFPWYSILVAGLLVLIAVIVIIIVIIWKKKKKQKVEPSDDNPASDSVANTRAPASAFAKASHNHRHNDEAGSIDVLRTLPPLNLQQQSLTVCNDNDTERNEHQPENAPKKRKKRRKKHKRREDLDDNDVNEDQAQGETEEHLIGVSKRRKRKKKHREKKMDEYMDGDDV